MNKPISSDEWLADMAEKVETEGPQAIVVEGHRPLMLISLEKYRHLERRRPTLLELLRSMDWSDVDLSRDSRPARDVEF